MEIYLTEIGSLRGATKETSAHPASSNLQNAIGHMLKPNAKCIIHPENRGAGILLQRELDANYQRVKANTFMWKA